MDGKDWIILEQDKLDEGIRYRFDDKNFTIYASTEGGYSGYSVNLTEDQARAMRDHLDKWLKIRKEI